MNVCIIETASSYGATAMLKTIASAGVRFVEARLNVMSYPTDSRDSKDWPLIFKCTSDEPNNEHFEIRIHMLTCGYSGSGPHDLLECLKISGFDHCISENEIFTNKHIVAKFTKSWNTKQTRRKIPPRFVLLYLVLIYICIR